MNENVAIPETLNAKLYDYQIEGFEWLYKNILMNKGSILADEMGLGKTIQVITCILKMKEDGLLVNSKVLIVIPLSVLGNWRNEIKKFAPTLSINEFTNEVLQGVRFIRNGYKCMNKKFDWKQHFDEQDKQFNNSDITITNYEMLDHKEIKDRAWSLIILDEAHSIKNLLTT